MGQVFSFDDEEFTDAVLDIIAPKIEPGERRSPVETEQRSYLDDDVIDLESDAHPC